MGNCCCTSAPSHQDERNNPTATYDIDIERLNDMLDRSSEQIVQQYTGSQLYRSSSPLPPHLENAMILTMVRASLSIMAANALPYSSEIFDLKKCTVGNVHTEQHTDRRSGNFII